MAAVRTALRCFSIDAR